MVELDRKNYEAILKHLSEAYPQEGCGLIAGRQGRSEKIFFLTNVEKSEVSFLADPKELLQAFKTMRRDGLELLGIFHSHPESDAVPSQRDQELAFYPDAYYLIVSMRPRHRPMARTFRIRDGRFEEEEVRIIG